MGLTELFSRFGIGMPTSPVAAGNMLGLLFSSYNVLYSQLSVVIGDSKVGGEGWREGAEGSSRSAELLHRGGGFRKPRAKENVAKKRTSCPTACSQAVVHAHDLCAALFGPGGGPGRTKRCSAGATNVQTYNNTT